MKEGSKNVLVVFLAILLIASALFNLAMIGVVRNDISRLEGRVTQHSEDSKNQRINLLPSFESQHSKSIGIVAVSTEGKGEIGNVSARIIPGENELLINTNPFLEPDVQFSAEKAVNYAKDFLSYDYKGDIIFDFDAGKAQLIGGGSAGAAMTILTLALLQNKTIDNETIITGTIGSEGQIGKVGGIMEKTEAVAKKGYKRILVPKGQSKVKYYERVKREKSFAGIVISNVKYVPREVDLKKAAKEEWGIEVTEVSDIEEAKSYFFEQKNKTE